MATEDAKRDNNHVTSMLFVGSDGFTHPAEGDEVTGRLKVDAVSSGVTSISAGTGILLTPDPITTTGSVALVARLQPIATLTGNSLKFLRVNVGETAVEYATVESGITIGTTTITGGTSTRILYNNAGVVGEYVISGSGNVAMTTSPVFTTPNIGAATATSVNGLTITASTGVLTITNAKTLAVTNTLTLSGTDSTVMTFPTTSATIARTDAAQSFTGLQTFATVKITTGAGAGKVLTSDADGDATWETPSGGTPTWKSSTTFETAARFSSTLVNGGTTTFDVEGLTIQTSSSATSSAQLQWLITANDEFRLFSGSPSFSVGVSIDTFAADGGSAFFGIGNVAVNGAGHTFTNNHIGFKLVNSGGTVSLFATQADGTTENASSALTTVVNGNALTLVLKVNGTASVDYYWKKGSGALSAATNLTSNLPTAATQYISLSATNAGQTNNVSVKLPSASYER